MRNYLVLLNIFLFCLSTQLRAAPLYCTSATSPVVYTDPTLSVGVTPIKAIHVNEIRNALNLKRTSVCSLPALTWAETITPSTTVIKKQHIDELRNAINSTITSVAAAQATTPILVNFSDPVLTIGVTPVKAVHMQELRTAVDNLSCGIPEAVGAGPMSTTEYVGTHTMMAAIFNNFKAALIAKFALVGISLNSTDISAFVPQFNAETAACHNIGDDVDGVTNTYVIHGISVVFNTWWAGQEVGYPPGGSCGIGIRSHIEGDFSGPSGHYTCPIPPP